MYCSCLYDAIFQAARSLLVLSRLDSRTEDPASVNLCTWSPWRFFDSPHHSTWFVEAKMKAKPILKLVHVAQLLFLFPLSPNTSFLYSFFLTIPFLTATLHLSLHWFPSFWTSLSHYIFLSCLPVLQHHGCNVLRKVAFAFISPSCAKEKMLFLLTPFYFSDYRLSKVYMVTTNLLFACLGFAFIAFGVIGHRDGFKGATLFPPNTFKRMWTWLTFSQDNDVFRS